MVSDGEVCWISTGGPDTSALAAFYVSVFGWAAAVDPDPDAGGYTNMALDGDLVAGVGFDNPLAPGWTMFVATSDADRSCAQVVAAGGAMSLPPIPIGQRARMSLVTDPAGAHFGFWEPQAFSGFERRGVASSFHRCQLVTADPSEAAGFYRNALGWQLDDIEAVEGPSRWRVWLGVDDVDAALDRALAAGGSLLDRPASTSALLVDSNGAELAITGIA